MNRMTVAAKVISVIIGYVFGCFITADIVSKRYGAGDPANIGSGNPGMANIMTNLGFKAGILVLAGDLGKTVLACSISYFIFHDYGSIIRLYAGLGTILGHDFPFTRKFKGGKGVSSTCMTLAMYDFIPGFLCDIAGMVVVMITGWLPLGAVVIPAAFLIPAYVIGGKEALILALAIMTVMITRHYRGIGRVINGKEKKIMDIGQIKKLCSRYLGHGRSDM